MGDGGAAPWIQRLLVVVVGFLGLHALFLLFEGNRNNGIVQFVGSVGRVLVRPFVGMFPGISRVGLCLVAILGYCLLAGIALAINNKVRTARARTGRAPRVDVDTTRRS